MRPTFLLWVVSPAELSDRAAADFILALERSPSRPSVGLITGSTIDLARGLYERARQARGDRAAVVLGEDTFSAPEVVESAGGERRRRSLSGAREVLDLLASSDYVHYAGHGANASWRPRAGARIGGQDIPSLPGVVISTMSCQTARVWETNSIALRMVDQGAAAYSGFFYSPLAGFQIGEDDGPFRYTWPEVPIGLVVEAMNAGARQGYARFPFHLLLGDPRTALRAEPPCRLVDHGESGGVRTLSCQGAPAGLVPRAHPGRRRPSFRRGRGPHGRMGRGAVLQPLDARRRPLATTAFSWSITAAETCT